MLWRSNTLAALALTVLLSTVTLAQAPKQPAELQAVPKDAALFLHADFAALWDSPIGDTFRKTRTKDLDQILKIADEMFGVKPEMVQNITAFLPSLKQPGDFSSFGLMLTFRKPFDRAKMVAAAEKMLGEQKIKATDKDGVFSFNVDSVKFRFESKGPSSVWFTMNLEDKYSKPRPADETGPLSDALAQAPNSTITMAINWANMPDELRKEELPPEARPYGPLFHTDAMVLTGKVQKDSTALVLKAMSTNKAKVQEAEKSLAAGLNLLRTILDFGIGQLEKSKNKEDKDYIPLLKATLKMMQDGKVSAEDSYAQVTSKFDNSLPYGPVLEQIFGGKMRDTATRNLVSNNLKQIALAMHNYESAHGGFPPAAICDKKGKPLLSWRVMILPYIEQDALYKQFRLDEPWDSEHNIKLAETVVKVYTIPGVNDDKNKLCHYRVFQGNGALFDPVLPCKLTNITDGTSNTGLVFLTAKGVPWTKPDEEIFDPKGDVSKLLLWQNEGTQLAFADGSVRFIRKTIDPKSLKALVTKDGGEVYSIDD